MKQNRGKKGPPHRERPRSTPSSGFLKLHLGPETQRSFHQVKTPQENGNAYNKQQTL